MSRHLGQLFTVRTRLFPSAQTGHSCILGGMIWWPRFNSSHRVGLVALALTAVLLPLVILSVVQYRSLADLEGKTRAAMQENLRQTLHGVSQRVQERLEALTTESLGRLEEADVEREKLDRLERQLRELRSAHPEIEVAFLVDHCSCRERNFALFATAEGVRRVDHNQFKRDVQTQTTVAAYNNAGLLQSSTGQQKNVLFEQSSCSFPTSGNGDPQLLVFSPLRGSDGQKEYGFAGMVLKSDYVETQLLPQSISESLSRSHEDVRLVVGILDEKRKEIYATHSGLADYEITTAFAPVFRRWKLGIGYQGTTIEALARRQFQQNLMLTLLALVLLTGGVLLTLRAIARERKLLQAKATFVSNVSHELKTPLSLIRLFAETLELGRVKDTGEMRDYGRIINRESSRLTQLINNILDFSRIEAGRREYQFAETDVAAVIEEVLESYDQQLKSAGFVLEQEIQPDLPPALIDREAMAQAVLNLLDNAFKYSAELKRIEVRLERRGEGLAIEIADRGIGIPRPEQRRIFEKFYRVSTGLVHNTKGSGLGLAIVRHIVEAHDGEILVESTPGKGSRFTILLPGRKALGNVATSVLNSGASDGGGYNVAENPHH